LRARLTLLFVYRGSSEAQDGAFASLNGAQLLEKAVTSSQHVIARSNALGGLLASNITPLDSAQVQSPESPLSPSSACQGTKGESKASSGFLATLSDSFRAVTTNLLAKPEPMVIAFCQTAKDGDVRHLKGFVSQGVNVNGRNEEGHTALICATRANQLDAIKYLVAAGADIAAKDTHSGQRQPPLFHAAECGHLEAAEMLMDLGANIHEVAWFNQPFFARVTDSDNLAMIEMFLDRGADPNATRNNGRTVVIDAIRSGSLDRLRLLHEHGGKITTRDITGQPPLHMALGQNRIDIIDFLLAHGADPSSTDNVGKSLLHAALQRKLYGLVKNLLIRGANPNVSDHMGTTFLATLVNDTTADDEMGPDLVRMVLTKGGNPNQPDSWGEPLLCRVMEKGNTKLLRAFLEHRANPNKDFRRLGTLLLYALDHGRYDHALLLLKHGADPNKADGKGRTPLLEALQMEAIPVVKELLAVGADVNLGGTVKPLQFARALGNQELVQLFLAGGAENPTRPAASISCSGIGGVRAVHFPLEPPGAGQSSQVEEEVPPAYSETHSS
jgi:ankyrin repeat protein